MGMVKMVVGVALRERLGEHGTRELGEFVERHSESVRSDVVNICTERLDETRIVLAAQIADVKAELSDKIADVKVELSGRLADLRVELLRWSFLFWVGQVAALFAAMAMFAEWIRP
jgi:hypothetical protein